MNGTKLILIAIICALPGITHAYHTGWWTCSFSESSIETSKFSPQRTDFKNCLGAVYGSFGDLDNNWGTWLNRSAAKPCKMTAQDKSTAHCEQVTTDGNYYNYKVESSDPVNDNNVIQSIFISSTKLNQSASCISPGDKIKIDNGTQAFKTSNANKTWYSTDPTSSADCPFDFTCNSGYYLDYGVPVNGNNEIYFCKKLNTNEVATSQATIRLTPNYSTTTANWFDTTASEHNGYTRDTLSNTPSIYICETGSTTVNSNNDACKCQVGYYNPDNNTDTTTPKCTITDQTEYYTKYACHCVGDTSTITYKYTDNNNTEHQFQDTYTLVDAYYIRKMPFDFYKKNNNGEPYLKYYYYINKWTATHPDYPTYNAEQTTYFGQGNGSYMHPDIHETTHLSNLILTKKEIAPAYFKLQITNGNNNINTNCTTGATSQIQEAYKYRIKCPTESTFSIVASTDGQYPQLTCHLYKASKTNSPKIEGTDFTTLDVPNGCTNNSGCLNELANKVFVKKIYEYNRKTYGDDICLNVDGENECVTPIVGQDTIYGIKCEVEQVNCPAGYYCSDGTKTKCPPGSSTWDKQQATKITDCYLTFHKVKFADINNPNGIGFCEGTTVPDGKKCIPRPKGSSGNVIDAHYTPAPTSTTTP